MNYLKYKTIKIGVSILLGINMVSMPFALANDGTASANPETNNQRLSRMAAEKQNRIVKVRNLVQFWSVHTKESEEVLFQAFYALSDQKLQAIETADNYDEVVAILIGKKGNIAAKGTSAKLGDQSQDLVYSPVKPCRIGDTRKLLNGTLSDGDIRSFYTFGVGDDVTNITDQGGDENGCPAPRGEPTAVNINITAIPREPEFNGGKGNIQATPKGTVATYTVLVKYHLGQNVSNGVIIRTSQYDGEEIDIRVVGNSADVALEILGYYYPVAKDDADRFPKAYGFINGDGSKASGTENFTSSWNPTEERYEILIEGESYFWKDYTTIVTSANNTTCLNSTVTTNSLLAASNTLTVHFLDIAGLLPGTIQQCEFQFVTFKNE